MIFTEEEFRLLYHKCLYDDKFGTAAIAPMVKLKNYTTLNFPWFYYRFQIWPFQSCLTLAGIPAKKQGVDNKIVVILTTASGDW